LKCNKPVGLGFLRVRIVLVIWTGLKAKQLRWGCARLDPFPDHAKSLPSFRNPGA